MKALIATLNTTLVILFLSTAVFAGEHEHQSNTDSMKGSMMMKMMSHDQMMKMHEHMQKMQKLMEIIKH